MIIVNKRTNKILANNPGLCKNIISQSIGLLLKTKAKPLLFIFKKEEKHAFHMIMVFCAIDIIFLDKNKKIVDMKEKFKPFEFFKPRKKAKYVLEVPCKTIKRSQSKIGDSVSFK